MRVTFTELTIKNFRQINARTFKFSPYDNYVIGGNGTGKTNSLHAITWALYGKDLEDRTKFEIVPLNPDNTRTNLVPDVTLAFTADGKHHTLRRTLTDGKAQTFIDGNPTQTLKEYDAFVAELFTTPDRFKMYTNPLHFPNLPWKEQRTIFMDFFPTPAPDTVIGRMVDRQGYAVAIEEELKATDPDRLVLKYTQAKKDREEEQHKIRGQIELLDEQLEGQQAMDQDALQEERAELWDKVRQANEAAAAIARDNADLEAERVALQSQGMAAARSIEEARSKAKAEHRLEIDRLRWAIEEKEVKRNQLRETYVKLSGDRETACPACGQELPKDQIKEKREAIKQQLTAIATTGSALSAEIGKHEEDLQALEVTAPAEPDVTEFETILALTQGKLAQLPKPRTAPVLDQQDVDRLAALDRALARADVHEENQARRQKLMDREREINKEYEAAETALREIADFLHYQAELIVEAVNRNFKKISVKVLEIQKNGTPRETFEILKDGVPFIELNTAGKLEAGLELTAFIKDQLKIECPTIIDNGESYTDVDFDTLPGQLVIGHAKKGAALYLDQTRPRAPEEEEKKPAGKPAGKDPQVTLEDLPTDQA